MSEAELANATWWAWLWGEIEHWAFLGVVVALAIEFAALKFGAPYKEKVEAAREFKIAQLNNETERLRKQIAPRAITGEQQKELAAALKEFKGQVGTIQASPATAESEMFVRVFTSPFLDAGWNMRIVPGTAGPTVLSPRGIIVWYRPVFRNGALFIQDQVETGRAANRLVDKLKEFGLEATAMPGMQMAPANTIEIIVSEK